MARTQPIDLQEFPAMSGEGGIRTLDGRNRPYRFSRPAHSTALPPLRRARTRLEDRSEGPLLDLGSRPARRRRRSAFPTLADPRRRFAAGWRCLRPTGLPAPAADG